VKAGENSLSFAATLEADARHPQLHTEWPELFERPRGLLRPLRRLTIRQIQKPKTLNAL